MFEAHHRNLRRKRFKGSALTVSGQSLLVFLIAFQDPT